MGFAGLWDAWKDAQGHWLQSFAIVTTEANELMASIHPRMPFILHSRDYDRWLDREETELLPLDLLRPYESEEMEVHEANPKVGNIRNNGPEMMRAAAKAAEMESCRCSAATFGSFPRPVSERCSHQHFVFPKLDFSQWAFLEIDPTKTASWNNVGL